MPFVDGSVARMATLLLPAIVVATAIAVSLLPHVVVINLLTLLGIWLLLSLPIGVVAGHCVLE